MACLAACKHEAEAPVSTPVGSADQQAAAREVTLFYPSSALGLVPERRELFLPEVETFAIAALTDELLREMSARWPGAFVPEGASSRAAYRLENTVVIDIEAPSVNEGWTTGSQAEILALQSIIHSITSNFREVDSVQILINGGEAPTFAGHIDLSKPLRPNQALLSR